MGVCDISSYFITVLYDPVFRKPPVVVGGACPTMAYSLELDKVFTSQTIFTYHCGRCYMYIVTLYIINKQARACSFSTEDENKQINMHLNM